MSSNELDEQRDNVTSIVGHKAGIDLAALVAEDKRVRGEKCLEEVNAALKAHNCTVNLFVHIGEHKFPLGAVITAPIEISIEAQEMKT